MREFKYDVLQLIQNVRDRPCLWDRTMENYKDRVERRNAWEEIFNALDDTYEAMTPEEKRLTGEIILNKWTNIRDTFMKSLKIKMGKPKKKYILYEHLVFLTKIIPEDERREYYLEEPTYMKQEIDGEFTITSEIEPSTITSFTISNATSSSSRKKIRNEYDDAAESSNGRRKGKSKIIFVDDLPNDSDSNNSKKKSKKSNAETNDVTINDFNDIDFVEVDDNDPRIMNEDEAFFASLLPTVVKYNEDERLQFRIEVLGVMKKLKEKKNW